MLFWDSTCLNCHALILISHFNIVNVHIETPDIYTVQAALVSSTDYKIIYFSALHGVKNQVESRCYEECQKLSDELGEGTCSPQEQCRGWRS
jgi:hypothetical protein